MTLVHSDDWLTVHGGDVRTVLSELPADSVHCVVTSPPYWGLRDYGTATWNGGDLDHAHRGSVARTASPGTPKQASKRGSTDVFSGDCPCGATRIDSQLGLERTPEEYVANMVGVFREVRRVLRPDGTLWLNLGDSYASGEVGRVDAPDKAPGLHVTQKSRAERRIRQQTGLKPKDLVGIPWRVAFALQADGWYLRSDIIWAKPNPMPESVTDRPTKSHEYLFLLTRSARYWYDAAAVAEGLTDSSIERLSQPGLDDQQGSWRVPGKTNGPMKAVGHLSPHMVGTERNDGDRWRVEDGGVAARGTRNLRSVWTVATAPYPGAHFATFPPKLVEPCIKAGCPDKTCEECGAPYERIIAERGGRPDFAPLAIEKAGVLPDGPGTHRNMGGRYQKWLDANPPRTTGWRSSCGHDASPVPGVVLDPFAGTGTVGMVAQRLSRRAVLIDLNPDYLRQCLVRNAQTPMGLVG